jgi:hypothetical protein
LSFATKASRPPSKVPAPKVVSMALAVGKFVEVVSPQTYALPLESTAMSCASSVPLPPR